MKLITLDDCIDLYSKSKQRGLYYLRSKLTFSRLSRTKSGVCSHELKLAEEVETEEEKINSANTPFRSCPLCN
tara:strand:+ start:256 stop:474 length:219 start_codon:yes stop_codon:yes gene_type:complete